MTNIFLLLFIDELVGFGMIDEKTLLEHGYVEYRKSPFESENVEKVYQKCFWDNHGRKYFLDVKKWEDFKHPHTGKKFPGGYEFETQLYEKGSHNPVNLLFLSGWSLDAVEAFVAKMFDADLLDYYENY